MFVSCWARLILWYTNLLLNIHNENYLMVSLFSLLWRSFVLSLQNYFVFFIFIMIMNIAEFLITLHIMCFERVCVCRRRVCKSAGVRPCEGGRERECKMQFDENVIFSSNYKASQMVIVKDVTPRMGFFSGNTHLKRNQSIVVFVVVVFVAVGMNAPRAGNGTDDISMCKNSISGLAISRSQIIIIVEWRVHSGPIFFFS